MNLLQKAYFSFSSLKLKKLAEKRSENWYLWIKSLNRFWNFSHAYKNPAEMDKPLTVPTTTALHSLKNSLSFSVLSLFSMLFIWTICHRQNHLLFLLLQGLYVRKKVEWERGYNSLYIQPACGNNLFLCSLRIVLARQDCVQISCVLFLLLHQKKAFPLHFTDRLSL